MQVYIPLFRSIFLSSIILFLASCKTTKQPTQNAPNMDNGQNSLDWAGVYSGVLPCADCEGIKVTLRLNDNLTFEEEVSYLGKGENIKKYQGNFFWNKDGNTITLHNTQDKFNENYFVGENTLTRLDSDGKKITNSLAQYYILSKSAFELKEKYWKLIELRGKPVSYKKGFHREPHLIFKDDYAGMFTGNTGCNSISGVFSAYGFNRLTITTKISTLMVCQDDDNAETDFLDILKTTDSYSIDRDTLTLIKARMAPLARFVRVVME